MALSKENESMLDDVDLSLEGVPSFDSSEAVDKAALRYSSLENYWLNCQCVSYDQWRDRTHFASYRTIETT